MKQIVLVALVLSVLLVLSVGTAFAKVEGDRDPGANTYKSGLEDNVTVVESSSETIAAGGGVTGAASGYEDSRLLGFAEDIR